MGCGEGPHTDGVVGLTNDGFGVGRHSSPGCGIAGYFESREGNTAPALQTLGDALCRAGIGPAPGVESRLFLGDGNHYIKSVAGQGVRIADLRPRTWSDFRRAAPCRHRPHADHAQAGGRR